VDAPVKSAKLTTPKLIRVFNFVLLMIICTLVLQISLLIRKVSHYAH
jgi:hypothetical protein